MHHACVCVTIISGTTQPIVIELRLQVGDNILDFCTVSTFLLGPNWERVHLRNTLYRLRSANEGNTDMGVP